MERIFWQFTFLFHIPLRLVGFFVEMLIENLGNFYEQEVKVLKDTKIYGLDFFCILAKQISSF
jgi:hypothetical protein